MHILVVDDVGINRNILRAMLEAKGHTIYEASDGVRAIEVLKENHADAVISDILMPNMDGLQLCRSLRNNEQFKNMPVIIYSSTHKEDNERKLAKECGASAFLEKPSPVNKILEAIETSKSACLTHINENGSEIHADVLKPYSEALVLSLERRIVALEEAEKKYAAIVNNIPAVVWSADMHGNTNYISPVVEKILGYKPQEIYDQGVKLWIGRLHPEDVSGVIHSYGRLFTEGAPFNVLYRAKRKDGSTAWIHDQAVATREFEGILYADGIFAEIHPNKDF